MKKEKESEKERNGGGCQIGIEIPGGAGGGRVIKNALKYPAD